MHSNKDALFLHLESQHGDEKDFWHLLDLDTCLFRIPKTVFFQKKLEEEGINLIKDFTLDGNMLVQWPLSTIQDKLDAMPHEEKQRCLEIRYQERGNSTVVPRNPDQERVFRETMEKIEVNRFEQRQQEEMRKYVVPGTSQERPDFSNKGTLKWIQGVYADLGMQLPYRWANPEGLYVDLD